MTEQQRQLEVVEFLIDSGVLLFGEFQLKSGRTSPYFFNLAAINTGSKISRLADSYADRILGSGLEFDLLFGPAYKGIPLAVSTAQALSRKGYDCGWAFNRKEIKRHGEGGIFVGAELQGKVLIVDDVLTAGSAIKESISLLGQTEAELTGAVVAMDREEKIKEGSSLSAVEQLQKDIGVPILSLVVLEDVILFFETTKKSSINGHAILESLYKHREKYGV